MKSLNLKHRAVLHYQLHLSSLRKVARIYDVGKSTLGRWIKQDLGDKARPRPKRVSSLHSRIREIVEKELYNDRFTTADRLLALIKGQRPDISVSRSSVYRTISKLGYSFKATSRSREQEPVPLEHAFMKSNPYDGDVIAIDESGFYWNDRPKRGWGPRGKRVRRGRPGKRLRVNLLLAVGKEGIVHYEIRTGTTTGEIFANFVRCLPDGRPIILDNASFHKSAEPMRVYAEKNIEPRFIPPYRPWYNPVEFCFSEIKAKYRPLRARDPSMDMVEDVLRCTLALAKQEAYFRHAEARFLEEVAAAARP